MVVLLRLKGCSGEYELNGCSSKVPLCRNSEVILDTSLHAPVKHICVAITWTRVDRSKCHQRAVTCHVSSVTRDEALSTHVCLSDMTQTHVMYLNYSHTMSHTYHLTSLLVVCVQLFEGHTPIKEYSIQPMSSN